MAVALVRPEIFPRDRDAIEIGQLYLKARNSIIEGVRYADEVGRRLLAKKDRLGHGQWLPWLAAHRDDLGFSERASQWLMAGSKWLAANPQLTTDLNETTALEISRRFWGNLKVRGTQGTGNNEWWTPEDIIEAARVVLGAIDLDPASTPDANAIVRAARIFTKQDDGLKHDWHGRVWLNPPYAQPLIDEFVSKMVAEYEAGRVTAGIMLTHGYTSSAWFHKAVSAADLICFTCSRVKFYQPDGTIAAPTQGQAIFYFGPDTGLFARVFDEVGIVLPGHRHLAQVIGKAPTAQPGVGI
jgi:phage N-6-adenine-methyltransferase